MTVNRPHVKFSGTEDGGSKDGISEDESNGILVGVPAKKPPHKEREKHFIELSDSSCDEGDRVYHQLSKTGDERWSMNVDKKLLRALLKVFPKKLTGKRGGVIYEKFHGSILAAFSKGGRSKKQPIKKLVGTFERNLKN